MSTLLNTYNIQVIRLSYVLYKINFNTSGKNEAHVCNINAIHPKHHDNICENNNGKKIMKSFLQVKIDARY